MPAVQSSQPSNAGRALRWLVVLALVLLGVASIVLAYQAQQQVQSLEQELVRRQQDSQEQATEARALARQAQDVSRDASAKVALVEARLAEVAVQRTQLEELMQSLSRSRDENLVVDIEASLRVAVQQTAITGSAEPLVAALKSADERLQRVNQPRLEGVRRAIARDLERVRSVSVADVSALVIRLDEAERLVDELPLVSSPASLKQAAPTAEAAASAPAKPRRVSRAGATASGPAVAAPPQASSDWWRQAGERVWTEAKSLIRVTRIDRPEAMLVAPEQAFFLRENLKLRLLNARLALLSRQFETVQSDIVIAQQSLERYFDGSARRTATVGDLLRQVASQAHQSVVPRPDDTFAALTAVAAGR
ncbi:uroporphyrinogen-III C-methyltransferase [Schlegelella sp. S2-27]|uniref:Uroporphyrinogen-III C-methyltransferase n=1 Tax=Caldimonas mangrovi TaxID=2944811 RepID=A0ABT0YLW5_9BURK|nr:uroporphyrinogen-III C-methyltransferase [Caldimonas mangrovi]MCM5678873.1 uroporphyrinogen-III C-methyltransferase [Caldimonas mangrovi]